MNLDEIWHDLEGRSGDSGFLQRRIAPESKQDLHLGIHKDRGQRVLLLDVGPKQIKLPLADGGAAVALNLVHLTGPARYAVELALTSAAYADLFNALINDIVSAVAPIDDASAAVKQFIGRFERWQAFLKTAGEGLSRQRQRGVFGELLVLRDTLAPITGAGAAVIAWTGPAQAPQDFTFGPVAVEVKTTASNRHQHLGISGERQLDTSRLDHLFLAHLSVDEQEGVGETLPELVADLRSVTATDPLEQIALEERLFAGGYHDLHAVRYVIGYSLREQNLFEVTGDFPRITEPELPVGIGEVHYSLAVSACTSWAVTSHVLANALRTVS